MHEALNLSPYQCKTLVYPVRLNWSKHFNFGEHEDLNFMIHAWQSVLYSAMQFLYKANCSEMLCLFWLLAWQRLIWLKYGVFQVNHKDVIKTEYNVSLLGPTSCARNFNKLFTQCTITTTVSSPLPKSDSSDPNSF